MSAAHTLQVSPLRAAGITFGWFLRFVGLVILYFILFFAGGGLLAGYLPTTPAEPGPLPQNIGHLLPNSMIPLIVSV